MLHILIVEDDATTGDLIATMLYEAGLYDTTHTHTLADGIHQATINPVDLVLLDLSLPDSAGIDTLLHFRAEHPDLPVIVLTVMDDTRLGVRSVRAGSQDYLVKGTIDPDILHRTIRYAMERHEVQMVLRQTEREYRSLIDDVFDNSTVSVLILDEAFKIVWINEATERYFGILREDVLGKDKRDLIRNEIKYIFEDAEHFEERVLYTYDNNIFTERFECHVLPDDDRKDRWLEHWSQPINEGLFSGGRIEQYMDITKRKRLENAEQEEQRFAQALHEITRTLTSTLELDEVIDRIMENVDRVVPHTAASVLLLEDDGAKVLRASDETGALPQPGDKIDLEVAATLRRMSQTREPLLLRQIDTKDNRDILHEQSRAKSYIGAPMTLQSDVIGFINLYSDRPNNFNFRDAERLMAFASQAAIGIQNGLLYAKASELAAVEERQRIARELHDSVNQSLFSSNIMIESALMQWDRDRIKARDLLTDAHEMTNVALAEMRVLLLELRPENLTQMPMEELIQQLLESVRSRKQFQLMTDIGKIDRLPPDVQFGLYRILQETLNNIIKHAKARHIEVIARAIKDLGCEINIKDDGIGFDPQVVQATSLGLKIMAERAESIGADFHIYSMPGTGTETRIQWQKRRLKQ